MGNAKSPLGNVDFIFGNGMIELPICGNMILVVMGFTGLDGVKPPTTIHTVQIKPWAVNKLLEY
jgi:hypothetical protein